MIYELAKEIAVILAATGCPYPVVYGPERAPASGVETRIVIERDRYGRDTFDAPKTRAGNPNAVFTRTIACEATIFAQSTLPGAGVYEHERVADQLADLFAVALHRAVRTRRNHYTITSSKMLSLEELDLGGIEAWPYVVYRITFTIDRVVNDVSWVGEAAPTAELGGEHGVSLGLTRTTTISMTADRTLPSVEVT